ncbi:MAG TPA: hypothetical protein PK544_07190 [Spirochaetota bacterium]|nr:hypothetical protein [Spirochaetota bacterium]HPJ37452.1 hypothetical protein [Spirochaetota bacterium]HPQ51999.1 hypothetical protein [Spirochaetota bacterium]
MDNSDLLNRVHNRMVNDLLKNKSTKDAGPGVMKHIIDRDQVLRKAIADLYVSLEKLNDPKLAVEMLAEHITMMVEMLNQFKGKAGR